jgi:hypothetical protein
LLARTQPRGRLGDTVTAVTSAGAAGRVAIVVRGDRAQADAVMTGSSRFAPLFTAFAERGLAAAPCMFTERAADETRRQLLAVDLALVWVDPVSGDDDRRVLDRILRDVAATGVIVSAHPDVVERMGTKDVLYATRELGWGGDVDRYTSAQDFRRRFPRRLALADGPRVLKQYRGNGGIGVWKVELLDPAGTRRDDARVRVQGARRRDHTTEEVTLGEFVERCLPYFAYNGGVGRLVDQPFQSRITDGLIRCYFVENEVIGFCRQYPAGATNTDTPGSLADGAVSPNTFGLPAAKTMFGANEPAFARLRSLVETTWVPQMQVLVGVELDDLPLLWDADFLFGARREDDGADTYVLCEINVSSVAPFPEETPTKLAAAAAAAVARTRRRR